jgi:hypothetical protein
LLERWRWDLGCTGWHLLSANSAGFWLFILNSQLLCLMLCPAVFRPSQEAERLGGTAHAAAAAEDQERQEQQEEEEGAAKELAIENSLRTVGEAYVGVKHTQVRGSGGRTASAGGEGRGRGKAALLEQAALQQAC